MFVKTDMNSSIREIQALKGSISCGGSGFVHLRQIGPSGELSSRTYTEGQAQWQKKVSYSKVMDNHFKFRHLVDDQKCKASLSN
jgi:hypothetical protein